ncbi:MAG: LptA/OstA family protein [Candidatus Zeuxoniibacter abyssi]|nr:MAG: LptA/OstA family protein [Candidatus Persebacteraceae bacterium AB1(2)]
MFKAFFPASVFTIFALCSFIASCVFYAANTKATESVEVNADNARYAPEGNIAVFSGNVFVKAQGWALVADALTVSVDADNNRSYKASGNPLRVSGEVEGQSIVANAALFKSSNDNAVVLMRNEVVFCVRDSCRGGKMHADEITWLRNKNRVIAVGNPIKFNRPRERENVPPIQASAQRIEYDISSGEIELSGAAKFKHGEGEINGELIVYNIKTGAFRVNATEGGRVRATFGEEK